MIELSMFNFGFELSPKYEVILTWPSNFNITLNEEKCYILEESNHFSVDGVFETYTL